MAMATQTGFAASKVLILVGAGPSLAVTIVFSAAPSSLSRRLDAVASDWLMFRALTWWLVISAGMTGSILLRNGRLSDVLGELQVGRLLAPSTLISVILCSV
jgi:hypothetical protein